MKQMMLLAAALVAIPIAAIAQTGLTPEQIVAARQSAYGLSAANFVQLKAQADAGVDVHSLVFSVARSWRAGRGPCRPVPGRAPICRTARPCPPVWSDRAGFEARAAAYAAAAPALAEAAQSGRPRRLPHPMGRGPRRPARTATTPISGSD